MGRAIGIDLGTTNSCAAYVQDGEPTVITYPDGSKTIPSVFAIDKTGKRLVGDEAKEQAAFNPENTITAAKRLIGRSFASDAVERMSQVFTYEIVEGDEKEVLVKVADQVLTLEQVSAAILMRIRDNAQRVLGEAVDAAVITVPAYFNDRQRQAVRAAGKLAGIHVLRVLNEPSAAALAYGLGRQLDQRVAVYDLGGGTFDISIIDIKDKVFEVVATGGDTFLGGIDFDDRLMQHVLKWFLDEHDIDLSYDRSAVTRIRDAAENAKIALSDEPTATIHLEAIAEGHDGEPLDLELTLSRDELEDLTRDLVERSVHTCERIFKEAGTNRNQVDELLLVGGQSRMPLVRDSLETFLGRPPSHKVHPDEAVAIGASIMAKSLSNRRPTAERDVTLLDVLPLPIGISKPDNTIHVLFPKNEPLPAKKTRTLTTSKDNQRSLAIDMYQGESEDVEDSQLLGGFRFKGLREAAKGDVRIEVTFHIDSEGILEVHGRDKDTGDEVQCQMRMGGTDGSPKKKKRKKKTSDDAPAEALDMPMAPSLGADDMDELDEVSAESLSKDAGSEGSGPSLADAIAEVEALIAPGDALRSKMNRPKQLPAEEPSKKKGGFLAWLKRLFGLG